MSTSAMPLMPMPPMPTKWIGPISLGSFIALVSRLSPAHQPDAPAANSWRCGPARPKTRKPLGRVDGALGARGGGLCYELLRRAGKRADFARQPIGREIVLAQAHRPARLLQHAGIGGLILIERVG